MEEDLVKIIQNEIKQHGLKLDFDGYTVKNAFGEELSIVQGETDHVSSCNQLTGKITLCPVSDEMSNFAGNVGVKLGLANSLVHEVGHTEAFPLDITFVGFILYKTLQGALKKARINKEIPYLKAFLYSSVYTLAYKYTLGEVFADTAASVFHNAPWSWNYAVGVFRLGKYIAELIANN